MKRDEFIAWVRDIEDRLRDPGIEFTQADRGKLADLLENLLRKWTKARGENDTIVWFDSPRTITR